MNEKYYWLIHGTRTYILMQSPNEYTTASKRENSRPDHTITTRQTPGHKVFVAQIKANFGGIVIC